MQGMIVFALILVLCVRRIPRVMRGDVKVRDIALDSSNWPSDARQAANAYNNQFELPVLLFVAGGIAVWLGASWWEASLCWLFVAARAVQAFVHVTDNNVFNRFKAFISGAAIIAVLWLTIGVRLLMEGFA
nr:MAPEG family protein [Pelagibacterium limicola]